MTRTWHVCIHGAGGLGSVIGARLARAGHQVTLIGRQAHMDAIKAHGLRVTGREDFVVQDNLNCVTHPDQVEGNIDYYILLTKQKAMMQALEDARALAGKIAVALTLQNGVGKEDHLVTTFGADKVIGGSIMEGGTLIEPGFVNNHVTSVVTAYFGELAGGVSERCEILATAFCEAGLNARAVDDIQHVLWEKVVQVGGASAWGASTLPGNPELDFGAGLTCSHGAAHYITIAKELLAVYRALGYKPQNFYAPVSFLKEIDEKDFDDALKYCLAVGEKFKARRSVRTSMHEDVLAGRKTEVDAIILPLVKEAERLGIEVPTLRGAYRVIKTLDTYCT